MERCAVGEDPWIGTFDALGGCPAEQGRRDRRKAMKGDG